MWVAEGCKKSEMVHWLAYNAYGRNDQVYVGRLWLLSIETQLQVWATAIENGWHVRPVQGGNTNAA